MTKRVGSLLSAFSTVFTVIGVKEGSKKTVDEGSQAPDWVLPGSDGKEHALSELLKEGAVVLAWFPKAFTPGCTIECKSLLKNGDKIRKYRVNYFMISVDPIANNTNFAARHEADFTILSDENEKNH